MGTMWGRFIEIVNKLHYLNILRSEKVKEEFANNYIDFLTIK